ncbi:MAG: PAS domain-containing sensor histidine kinase [Syntrophobacterales bacterium]|jgi:PAS domain S-box-containing protein
MSQVEKTKDQLLEELDMLRQRIDQLEMAEDALREAEEQYRTLVERANDAIIIIQDEKTVYRNPTYENLLGYGVNETTDQSFLDFVVSEDRETVRQHYYKRLQGEHVPDEYEVRLMTRSGEPVTMEVKPCVIEYKGASATMVVMRNVTERRRMENALELMRSRLLNLLESERSKISRVLHDTIGQNISILDFNLATIVEMLEESSRERISGLIENMRWVIRETGDKLRDISSGLHPRLVQELGLVAGVKNLVDRLRKTTGFEVKTSIQVDDWEIEESVAVNLYRIVQEAFTNIVKHSKCNLVSFSMALKDGRLEVMIRDNGTGFSLKDVSQRDIEQRGMGLFIMEERAKAIGGSMQIHSEPQQGTELHVEVVVGA